MKKYILAIAMMAAVALTVSAQWAVTETVDPITDVSRATFIYTEDGFSPALAIRFEGSSMDAFIYWRKYFDKAEPVIVRFDKEEITKHPVTLSSDGTATFFLLPFVIIANLLTYDQAVFRAMPYRENPVTLIVPCAEFKELYAQYKARLDLSGE